MSEFSVLPDTIVLMETPFGIKAGCTVCGEECFITDYDLMTAKKIEFNHECKLKLNGGAGGE